MSDLFLTIVCLLVVWGAYRAGRCDERISQEEKEAFRQLDEYVSLIERHRQP